MTDTIRARAAIAWGAVFAEPLALVRAQPHQALISTASVALMAQFAASGDILHPSVAYTLAIGVEWAYLRGLASDAKAPTAWGAWLNWSAFVVVVLWGSLWCLKQFGVIIDAPQGWLAGFLALAHVVPIAWLSLCSAMTHRASALLAAEQAEADRLRAQAQAEAEREARNTLHLEIEREQARLAAWKDAQQFKATLATVKPNQPSRVAQPFAPGQMGCKHCGLQVGFSTPSEKGVLVRLGCAECRQKRKK